MRRFAVLLAGLAGLAIVAGLFAAAPFPRKTQAGGVARTIKPFKLNDANGKAPPMYGPLAGKGVHGSVFYHLLPYIEQENLYKTGPDTARQSPLKVLQHPADPTIKDGTFELSVGEGLVHVVATRPCEWQPAVVADLDVLLATGKDGADDLFDVPAGGRDDLDLEVEPLEDVGAVSGRIVTEEGAPVATILWAHQRHGGRGRPRWEVSSAPLVSPWLSTEPRF